MKRSILKTSGGIIAAVGTMVLTLAVPAQSQAQDGSKAPVTAAAAAVPAMNQPAPAPLSYGVMQVLQLSQAKINDSTILAFIQNSGTGYTLSADQIIYLKQQGISDAILNAMLTKYNSGASSTASAPAPAATAPEATTTVAPATTTTVYVPSTTTYYYTPAYYGSYYPYSYYNCWPYPAVSFSFGYRGSWGGGWHGGGGGWHGGGGHGGHR